MRVEGLLSRGEGCGGIEIKRRGEENRSRAEVCVVTLRLTRLLLLLDSLI